MEALLILERDIRLLVSVPEKTLRNRITKLISTKRHKEAFRIIISKGMVEDFLPAGRKLSRIPDLTLIEDLL